ncbi:MAG: potassium transporter TrkA [Campylobacter sp.]|nr:potassium transporter TrkA [Campylobacter sp.]
MKNILVVCDGILAKNFLKTIATLKNINHTYTIVYNNDETISEEFKADNIVLEKFDATSLFKLRECCASKFHSFMIILDDKQSTKNVYLNLKKISFESEIYMLDNWKIIDEIEDDKYLKTIDSIEILTSRLVGYLPDYPVLADDIGLGAGEIMEVKVPIGSSYAYKRVGMFVNSKYKIPMIYRHNEAIVTKFNTMIFPNDTLLMVGEPAILKDVYSTIKTAHGQFPAPFGVSIYLIIDMANSCKNDIKNITASAKYINSTITSHKLYIRIINPTNVDDVKTLVNLETDESCEVMIEYKEQVNIMKSDVERYKIGMVISCDDFFEKHKKYFYELRTPVLTLGDFPVNELKKGIVLLSSKSTTIGASVVFDLCSQLGLDVYIYYYDQTQKEELISYYTELSELFNKKLFIINSDTKNPFYELADESKFLQFVPFNESILKRNFRSNLSKDLDELYFKLERNYQLFIPDFIEI